MDLIKPGRRDAQRARVRRFALKLQQFTGPVMAKSLEDTAFYRYHRLLALNEVGGDPAAEALSIASFHRAMRTARGVAARNDRDRYARHQARRRRASAADRAGRNTRRMDQCGRALEDPERAASCQSRAQMRAPSATFEYMLYQALLGRGRSGERDDSLLERIQAYALKAAREGKQETSWLNPNEAYENGVRIFIDADPRS